VSYEGLEKYERAIILILLVPTDFNSEVSISRGRLSFIRIDETKNVFAVNYSFEFDFIISHMLPFAFFYALIHSSPLNLATPDASPSHTRKINDFDCRRMGPYANLKL